MIVEDIVFGKVEVSEPILVELLNCPAMQRLKGVGQLGTLPKWAEHKGHVWFSRYEHSIGTMLLLRKLGASVNEQIAGLLHDVSHTAFSHVVDWALGSSKDEDFQDKNHESFIKTTEILSILDKYNINHNCALDPDRFSLLERPAPALCADRIDYTLREKAHMGERELVNFCVMSLKAHNGQIVCDSKEAAVSFWKAYSERQDNHWGCIHNCSVYHLIGRMFRQAFDTGLFQLKDLYTTDDKIVHLLKSSTDDTIKEILTLLDNGFEVLEDSNGIELQKKFRHVNPSFLEEGKIKKVSEVVPEYSAWFQEAKKRHGSSFRVKLT